MKQDSRATSVTYHVTLMSSHSAGLSFYFFGVNISAPKCVDTGANQHKTEND
ncbi:MAG TPA: hypothetical protein VEK08_16830 [Planctomycetota bacterium]|nr:hypothetical protein [Planctomycetota bacterium]